MPFHPGRFEQGQLSRAAKDADWSGCCAWQAHSKRVSEKPTRLELCLRVESTRCKTRRTQPERTNRTRPSLRGLPCSTPTPLGERGAECGPESIRAAIRQQP
jgi:hypothetical protein